MKSNALSSQTRHKVQLNGQKMDRPNSFHLMFKQLDKIFYVGLNLFIRCNVQFESYIQLHFISKE